MDKRPPALRTIVIASLGLAGVVILIENLIFPNLHTNGGILLLAILTPLLASLVVGVGIFGAGRQLPKRVPLLFAIGLVAVMGIDVVVFAIPVFTPGTKVQEQSPFTVSATATTAPVSNSPTPRPTSLPQWRGTFDHRAGVDTVAGDVIIGTTADGKLVLRLENLAAANGSDLYVYLSKDASPADRTQVMNGIEVGKLAAPRGSSNYNLPAGNDITQFKSVVIYCKSFSAIFGYANLSLSASTN